MLRSGIRAAPSGGMLALMEGKTARALGLVVLWTAVGLFFASGGSGVIPALIKWYIWGLLGWAMVSVDRRLPVLQERLWRRLAWHIPLSVVFTTAALYLLLIEDDSWRAHAVIVPGLDELGQVLRMGGVQWNLLNYWLILAAYLAYQYHREVEERRQRAAHLENLLTEARLSALRAQLHPHFLFNALNTVSAYVEADPQRARAMLAHLGDLLRFSLDSEDRREVSLEEEIAALDHYLGIQQARFAGRLRTFIQIPAELYDARVPALVLQPLVENAITHGLRDLAGMGEIRVSALVEKGDLVLSVSDNGAGLPDGWLMERDARIGLANTRSRLTALYGERQDFSVSRGAAGGVVAEMRFPCGFGTSNEKGGHRAEVARAYRG